MEQQVIIITDIFEAKDYYPSDFVPVYIREIAASLLPKDAIIPLDITTMCQKYAFSELIVPANQTKALSSGVLHEYDRIIINEYKYNRSTTTNWNGTNGGKLFIKCKYLEI